MILAYFFVPLPEPLGLPDGFIFDFSREPTYEELLEIDREATHHHQEQMDSPLLKASLQFWRAQATTDLVGDFTTLYEIACRALPELPQSAAPAADGPAPTCERTVVEMVVPVAEDGSDREKALSDAFDVGLDCLRTFQRAYCVASSGPPITLATRERMPPSVPFGVRHITNNEDRWPDGLGLFLVNMNLQGGTRQAEMTDDQVKTLSGVMDAIEHRLPSATYREFVRESHLALDRDGDYRAAVVFTATAAEVLLDGLLSHLLWEERLRPEEAAEVFDNTRSLVSRARSEFHGRLGGDWSSSNSPVAGWQTDTASTRHRVVHAGHEPDRDAAVCAVRGTASLEAFVVERVGAAKVVARYPRTALKFLGEPSLRRRGRWSKRIEELSRSPDEPHWDSTFFRWREAMNQFRKGGQELAVAPNAADAVVMLVVRPDGRRYFAVHDRNAAMAGLLPTPPDGLPRAHEEVLCKILARLGEDSPREAVSIRLAELSPWAVPEQWRPRYRVIPLAGVMVNGKDLDNDLGE